ncbi:type IX secretion system protein PorD [Spirosoma lituiforme]
MNAIRIFLLVSCLIGSAQAQELNCQITVNSDQLFAQQKTDFAYLSQLKGIITEFMNNRRWSNDQFGVSERINCSMNINLLKSLTQGVFEATAQITVTRPVYGTNYETTTFTYVDRAFNFVYLPTTPVYFRDNQFSDDLTSLLAFYANVILAVDYDTFSKQGGNPYVQRAYSITNLAQQGSANAAWQTGGDRRNRFWLIENMQNQQLIPFRDGLYTYHRQGLDVFAANPVQARKQTLNFLSIIRTIGLQLPNSVLINSFFEAKSLELYNILYEGTPAERKQAFDLLSFLDPSKTESYRKLIQ